MTGPVTAGMLRHIVTIQALDEGQDSTGAPLTTYTTVATGVPAFVNDLTGRELLSAQQINPQTNVGVRMRYYAGLTPKHRLVDSDGRNLEILAVLNPDSKRIETRCICLWRGAGSE